MSNFIEDKILEELLEVCASSTRALSEKALRELAQHSGVTYKSVEIAYEKYKEETGNDNYIPKMIVT